MVCILDYEKYIKSLTYDELVKNFEDIDKQAEQEHYKALINEIEARKSVGSTTDLAEQTQNKNKKIHLLSFFILLSTVGTLLLAGRVPRRLGGYERASDPGMFWFFISCFSLGAFICLLYFIIDRKKNA